MMNNQEYSYYADRREKYLIYPLQVCVILGVLSYDTIVSMNPFIYYGARIFFLISIIILFCIQRHRTSLARNMIFLMLLSLFLYHAVQSLVLDLLLSDGSNTIGFMKVMLPRFLFFLTICLIIGSISRPSFWTIIKPIVYLGTLFAFQGIISAIIVYFEFPISTNYSITSYFEMLELGPYAIFGYGNSIRGNILRAQSIFAECNVLARFLGVAIWTTFLMYLKDSRKKYLIFLFIQSVCLILTYSISAFIGMTFSILVWWLMLGRKSVIILKSIVSLVIIAGIIYMCFKVIPAFVSENEIYDDVGVVISRYSFENIGTERPMAGLTSIYEYLINNPLGKGFSSYITSSEDILGAGSSINTWIRLGGITSIFIWILLFSYLVAWYVKNVWLHNIKDSFTQCMFALVAFYTVASVGHGSFLETFFWFYLAIIGTLSSRSYLIRAPTVLRISNIE